MTSVIKSTIYSITDNLLDYQSDYHIINTGCQQPYSKVIKTASEMA